MFREYIPKTRGATNAALKEEIVMSYTAMRFSKEFWERELLGAERIRLLFDKEANQVGIIPVDPQEVAGFRVQEEKSKLVMNVRIKNFNLNLDLLWEKPTSFKVMNMGSNTRMRIIDLNQYCKTKRG